MGPRVTPKFPISLWNARTAALDLDLRTTNAVEGWHNGLKATLPRDHPTMWQFCEGLQAQQAITELRIEHTRDMLLDVTPRKKFKDRALRLQELAATYDRENLLRFLASIAHVLKN